MACTQNDTTNNIPRIVRGNDFTLKVDVKKPVLKDGETTLEDFPIEDSTDISVNLVTQLGARIKMPYTVSGSTVLVNFEETVSSGLYGLEVTGKQDGKDWRFYAMPGELLEIVEPTSSAYIPSTDTVDGYYSVTAQAGVVSISEDIIQQQANSVIEEKIGEYTDTLALKSEVEVKADKTDLDNKVDTNKGTATDLMVYGSLNVFLNSSKKGRYGFGTLSPGWTTIDGVFFFNLGLSDDTVALNLSSEDQYSIFSSNGSIVYSKEDITDFGFAFLMKKRGTSQGKLPLPSSYFAVKMPYYASTTDPNKQYDEDFIVLRRDLPTTVASFSDASNYALKTDIPTDDISTLKEEVSILQTTVNTQKESITSLQNDIFGITLGTIADEVKEQYEAAKQLLNDIGSSITYSNVHTDTTVTGIYGMSADNIKIAIWQEDELDQGGSVTAHTIKYGLANDSTTGSFTLYSVNTKGTVTVDDTVLKATPIMYGAKLYGLKDK